jgi:hypothetical protein
MMTEFEHGTGLGTYEIRVQGWLGPLLLSVLPHAATAQVPRHTLLIAEGSDERDLVEIVELIVATGLEMESVRVTTHTETAVLPSTE